MLRQIRLPDLGAGVQEATVVSVEAKEGDFLQRDDIYLSIETEKSFIQVPVQYSGWVKTVHVQVNDIVHTDRLLVTLDSKGTKETLDRADVTANIRAALQYLQTRPVEVLCKPDSEGVYNFADLLPHVTVIVDSARLFERELLDSMPQNILIDLQHALFDVTDIVAVLEGFGDSPTKMRYSEHTTIRSYVKSRIQVIESFLDVWKLVHVRAGVDSLEVEQIRQKLARGRNEVFVVHGHDDGAKQTVARFLEKCGLKPIILHEQGDNGLTIIEKFERNSNVSFAVAIFTPDDVGRSIKEPSLRKRSRQNVIFEFGYFLGVLGRHLVAALIAPGIEMPSDYSGVLYIPFKDDNQWRQKLFRQLRGAGLEVSDKWILDS